MADDCAGGERGPRLGRRASMTVLAGSGGGVVPHRTTEVPLTRVTTVAVSLPVPPSICAV